MPEDIISIDHLTKTFGDFTAVNDISFSVNKGEIVAFLGPNGAGKTTLLRMLGAIITPTAGDCRIAGVPNDEIGRASCRERV